MQGFAVAMRMGLTK